MIYVPFEQIRFDEKFIAACEAATKKAQKAADRANERLRKMEEKELARHEAAIKAIDAQRRAVFETVYNKVYQPLDDAAFKEAERRIAAAMEGE